MSNEPKAPNEAPPQADTTTEETPVVHEGELLDEQPADTSKTETETETEEAEVAAETAPADPAMLQQEIDTLSDKLAVAESRAEENWNRFLGAQAEMQNVRKRAERDLQNERKFALEKFLKELLPIKDSLEMGIEEGRNAETIDKLLEGSELTLKMFASAVEKFGVQEIDPLGQRFDPECHEAMAMQPSDEAEPNTVLQVIRKGYSLNERVLRPAMVIVARAAEQDKA